MAPRTRGKALERAFIGAVFGIGLCLGACSGDDNETPSGDSGGSLNLSGVTSAAGSSTGAMTSGGSNDQRVPSEAGAGGEDATGAGSANGGSTPTGGSASSGGNGLYLHCESAADCQQYGGGKVCCEQGTMLFCTKPSACSGKTLP